MQGWAQHDGRESPFHLDNERAYQSWRRAKLESYPRSPGDLRVVVRDLARPLAAELDGILGRCRRANMAIYASGGAQPRNREEEAGTRRGLAGLIAALGLGEVEQHRSAEADGLVAIEVSQEPAKRGFIPYTARALSWHTDGYYNAPEQAIRSMVLHCVRTARSGGENTLVDPEIAYIRLRDANPRWVAALMHPEAMTIPECVEEDGRLRPASAGPVFAVDEASGSLLTRYTARGRNIVWRNDESTAAGVAFLDYLLGKGHEPLILNYRLAPGEGIVCNNVLHARTAFEDGPAPGRLMYRARFSRRIAGTGFNEVRIA
ncbi:MAG: TauD/TfdA family dioxygenase [Hyphomicrobiaceae bacterium]|nr:MAG: TauD/TfdA family dioxygenase [Hyphomicrobiaceae bacterium]